ncbi:hypothetical protein NDU88_004138 [Pleurodeles waltl]|uniref:Uncharacterized protein n=1 Tax=Pleurodeles waltl TaxID=8319 RepID=A0AAV7NRN6_PLEWA|nr:hypothetical protein NDU88_004138 [Pleurodeles waltl]
MATARATKSLTGVRHRCYQHLAAGSLTRARCLATRESADFRFRLLFSPPGSRLPRQFGSATRGRSNRRRPATNLHTIMATARATKSLTGVRHRCYQHLAAGSLTRARCLATCESADFRFRLLFSPPGSRLLRQFGSATRGRSNRRRPATNLHTIMATARATKSLTGVRHRCYQHLAAGSLTRARCLATCESADFRFRLLFSPPGSRLLRQFGSATRGRSNRRRPATNL